VRRLVDLALLAGSALALASMVGCGARRQAPLPRTQETFDTANASVNAVLQIPDATIKSVDICHSPAIRCPDSEGYRGQLTVLVANRLHDMLGRRREFSKVVRTDVPHPMEADYIVDATYDFFHRYRVGPLPGAGVSMSWIREFLGVRVTATADGTELLKRGYATERRDDTSGYTPAHVTYLQDVYLSEAVGDIVAAIENHVALNADRHSSLP